MQILPSPRLVISVLVLVQVLFGINYAVSKVLVVAFPPLIWAAVRSLVTVVLIGLVVDVRGKPHPRGGWKFFGPLLFFSAVGVVINQGSFLIGISYTTPTNSAVLNTLIPVFTLLFVVLLGREKLTRGKLTGFLCAFIGVLILLRVEDFRLTSHTAKGDLLTLLNTISFGLYLSLSKRFLEKHDRPWVTLWMFIIGSIGFTSAALPSWPYFQWPRMGIVLWGCLLYAILAGTFLTYLLNNWVLAYAESSKVALFIYLQPLVATFVSWWWFGEYPFSARMLVGSAFIFAGVYFSSRTSAAKKAPVLRLSPQPRLKRTKSA